MRASHSLRRFLFAALLPASLCAARDPRKAAGHLFQTSDRCMACHNGLATSSGEDISIGFDWRPTMMANSSRDPYWQSGVRREITDHPESRAVIEDECSICHMPMARYQSKQLGREGEIFAHLPFDATKPGDRLAEDGVSCSLCHQIGKSNFGKRESFVGGFVLDGPNADGQRVEYGPFEIDKGHTRVMRTSTGGFRPTEAKHIRQSELCATCHTLYTKALGPGGKVIGELPEQVPYQEWLHSDYREKQSCQSCHMPVVKEDVRITNVLGEPRQGMSRHVFVGGNFFILGILNRYRNELSVGAEPQELSEAVERTTAFLQSQTARVAIGHAEVRDGRLLADVSVENLGGHKLPTAYPSRRVWLHFVVRDRNHRPVFESGALTPQGSIVGNANDADPGQYEPHYTEITASDQVQIYESIMADQSGSLTTALLSSVRYVKDNRLLPHGFEKSDASQDIAVVGGASSDENFTGAGDRVRYSVALGASQGPYVLEAELYFQPISYRWAANLRKYDTAETRRFNGYYDSMSSTSAIVLARAAVTR
jgi:hypothetical protein